jgi:prolyl oligopeptidase
MNNDYLWLENINDSRALDWVADRNADSLERLQGDERYELLKAAAIRNYTAMDRIPYGQHLGGRVHSFWQDNDHVKGLWRVTTLESYATDTPDWTTLLDLDLLAAEEGEDWVYKGKTCLAPGYERCLIHLSRGGGDAVEVREFDIAEREFVDGGFFVAEAKTSVAWLDDDHVLVASDVGPGSLTTAGYPRTVRKWRRGSKLEEARVIFTADKSDTLVNIVNIYRPEGDYVFIIRVPEFFKEQVYLLAPDDSLSLVPLPDDADFEGVFGGQIVARLKSDWLVQDSVHPAGSVVVMDLESAGKLQPHNVATVFAPEKSMSVREISSGRDSIFLSFLDDVSGMLVELKPGPSGWISKTITLPGNGSINLIDNDPVHDITMFSFESLLEPPRLYLLNQGAETEVIKSSPHRFADSYRTEQRFAISKDGTRVPYYVVASRNIEYDGSNPTYMFAYGGFNVPLTPEYVTAMEIEWLKAGGVYVKANLRGGGEYGPQWHQSALLKNRQRVFDDYIAVAEDLIASGITSPERLVIKGRSNGGLLVTVALTQRPDLFAGIICAVPLIDMLRYHRLSAGASWMAEYGNPDIPEQAKFIAEYSPFQLVSADADYPEVFFWTNMKDDRVHPGHARRMVAKMLDQGHEVLYYENSEGGHAGGADPIALAHITALELVYLMQKVMD